ncbi:putative transposase [Shigella boydii 965-58]|nr:putative transposase [Shigella boydii 965-58]
MNSQTTKDIPCFRSYLPDALRLRFEDKLTIRAIAQRLGLSHSTIHKYAFSAISCIRYRMAIARFSFIRST